MGNESMDEALKIAKYLKVELKPYQKNHLALQLKRFYWHGWRNGQVEAFADLGENVVFALGQLDRVFTILKGDKEHE